MDRDRGGCCGCLILLLAIFGAYQLYERLSYPSECEGYSDWARTATSRFNAASRRSFALDAETSTRTDLIELSDSLREDAAAQQGSDPPDAATELNGELVDFSMMMAQQWRSLADSRPPPFTDREILDANDRIIERQEHANATCA